MGLGKLLDWYDQLGSRTVDLVGDYAGDEPFIIEGDSLLLHSFSDPSLDFSPGLQILHATYIVETLLHKLHQRRCVFHIAFFADNAHLCIPHGTPVELHARYLLTRQAIIQHLTHNVSRASGLETKVFQNYQSEEFKTHLSTAGTYFFMCHDGASVESPREDGNESIDDSTTKEQSDIVKSRLQLRAMIHSLVCQGYNIALINSVEFRDTKVMAMIVEGSAQLAQELLSDDTPVEQQLDGLSLGESQDSPKVEDSPLDVPRVRDLLQNAVEKQAGLTHREYLVVVALCLMLESGKIESTSVGAQAILVHTVLLREIRLEDRAVESPPTESSDFFNQLVQVAFSLISSEPWREVTSTIESPCDLSDLLDGRMFLELTRQWENGMPSSVASFLRSAFDSLASLIHTLCGVQVQLEIAEDKAGHGNATSSFATQDAKKSKLSKKSGVPTKVLPFNNSVFDAHLQPVQLTIDQAANSVIEQQNAKAFKELSHWHNHKRPLDQKAKPQLTPQQVSRMHRRNQFFMAEMRDYAVSLSNTVGGILTPESVFVTPAKGKPTKPTRTPPALPDAPTGSKPTKGPQTGGGKKANSKTGKPSVKEMAASTAQRKEVEAMDKHMQKWIFRREGFDKETDLVIRYNKVKDHLSSLPKESRYEPIAEILTYQLDTLIRVLIADFKDGHRERVMTVAVRIWETIGQITKLKQVSADIALYVEHVIQVLGLPSVKLQVEGKQKLSFQRASLPEKATGLNVGSSTMEFQLNHTGPFMDRNMDSAPDSRTPEFEPDRWQRDVLDQIDAKKSVFVVAPTSAGKTFISFYAMKQVLQEDNDGVLVYVAPTKALVNQIAAEIQARFSKKFPDKVTGKSVWAIHTRDYRINNPTGCQVLVTVPHILQIMLLAPAHAKTWSSRVRRIIFDEIHCIGQTEDGVVWEQLLLLAPCPIIALSATVGNPQKFCDWLALTQKANDVELKMIEHRHRYSDLRKYIYQPPKTFSFTGFSDSVRLSPLGLDGNADMTFIHPVATLVDRSRGLPDDLSLEPRDCFSLWQAMCKYQTAEFPVEKSLDPSVCLPAVIRKIDVFGWEARLKDLLKAWMEDPASPFDSVLNELSQPATGSNQVAPITSPKEPIESDKATPVDDSSLLDTTLPLICSLHAQNALPALFFNYDRSKCEDICHQLLTQFKDAEAQWKATSPAWKSKLAKFEEWKRQQERQSKKKPAKASTKKGAAGDDAMSKDEQKRDAASADSSPFESFDPEQPVDGFHLADVKKLPRSALEEYAGELRYRSVPEWLIEALGRGIGVHHAGMNRKYRQVCEMLFRKGFLRVVIATGTLALGINMPCKTVIFSGDSIFLTALNFRQAAGRAGRRGFDMLGNVVFQGVSHAKICRLISSRLPDLNGHFPITTSLVLRLCILLHESKRAPFAIKAINSILSCPRIYLSGEEMKDTVLHHLRFSIEYLRRSKLLDSVGAPLNFAGCVSHLYYTESSSFAFHALLESGWFNVLCKDINDKPLKTISTLMLVMSHIFGRQPVRQSVLESYQAADKKSSSILVLPPMPQGAADVLRQHNKKTLDIYAAYVSTFIEQHVDEPDRTLPLSNLECGGGRSSEDVGLALSAQPPPRITSSFVALSGHRDKWNTISDLCKMVRSGVWIEEAVIPHVVIHPDESQTPLNAYLYDFFNHGNVQELDRANGIRRGDIWFVLNDFSMVLATIVTSLENFLKLPTGVDGDMIDVSGGGDVHEMEQDGNVVEMEVQGQNQDGRTATPTALPTRATPSSAAESVQRPAVVKKKPVADSWDDDMSDESSDESGDDVSESTEPADTGMGEASDQSIMLVLKAFKMLQEDFNTKFRVMWA